MTVPATATLQALKTHLATITTANGYRTTVGAVYTGRAALALGTQMTAPVITLTSLRDDPEAPAASWFQTWKRTVELEAILPESTDWDANLDDVFDDIRKALVRFPIPLEFGSVVFFPPENGGDHAVLLLPITYSYVTNYADS